MRKLFVRDIERLANENKIANNIKAVASIFLKALNDWPIPIDNLDDFEIEIHNFIKGKTTKVNIENALKEIDFSKYAWQAESLTQLIEVYDLYNTSLTEVIQKLKWEGYNRSQ